MRNTLKKLAALVLLGSFACAAQARLVYDDSKKVLVVNLNYNGDGSLKSRLMTIGEYTMSTKYGFQVQGLFDNVNVLRFAADSQGGALEAFPDIPAIGNLNNTTLSTAQTLADQHMRNYGYVWGESTFPPNAVNPSQNNRRVLQWMKRNGVSKAIFAFNQGLSTASEFGGGSPGGRVYFTKVLNIDGRSYFGKPVVEVTEGAEHYVNAIYYPLTPEAPIVDPRTYRSSFYNGTKGGLLYSVMDNNGAILGSRYADSALGAFDNWSVLDTTDGQTKEEDFADCTFKSREYRETYGPNPATNLKGTSGSCLRYSAKPGFPTGDDLYRIMGRNNAKTAGLMLNYRPKVNTEDQADGNVLDRAWNRVTYRNAEYRACSVQIQQWGTYDIELDYSYSQWLFNLDGTKNLLMANKITDQVNNLDYFIHKFTYKLADDWNDPVTYPAQTYNVTRAKLASPTDKLTTGVFDVLYRDMVFEPSKLYSVNGGTYPNNTVPGYTISGTNAATRVNKTFGDAVFKAECDDTNKEVPGLIKLTLGRSSSTGANAVGYNMRWSVYSFDYSTNPAGRSVVRPSCTDYSSCAARATNTPGEVLYQEPWVATSGVNSNFSAPLQTAVTNCAGTVYVSPGYEYGVYVQMSEPWMNETLSVGDAMTTAGTSCGQLYNNLKQIASANTDTGICPAGFTGKPTYANSYTCNYGTKTVCTTTNDANGNPVTTCTTQPDTTVWNCSYSGFNTTCGYDTTGGVCAKGGTLKTVYDSSQGSPTPPGTAPTAKQVCAGSTQHRLWFWIN